MSITIRSDELNLLVYKYLLQSNLSHTAFVLFNQAKLEHTISQYKYDLKPAHLISLLEKALIFNQIQSHITINDYEECHQPFYLLKSHICRITQKAQEDKDKILEQMNQQIYSSMRRASSIQNTLVPNKEYQEIIYDHRSPYFFDKSAIKFSGAGKIQDFALKGNREYLCAKTGNQQAATLSILQYNESTNDFCLQKILPCCSKTENLKINTFQIISDSQMIVRVFEGNLCEVNHLNNEQVGYFFGIPLSTPVTSIHQNPKFSKLVTFTSQSEYCIVYFAENQQKCLKVSKGKFLWINSHQFFTTNEKYIVKHSLKNTQEESKYFCPIAVIEHIKLSESEIYFSAESMEEGIVCVYTFDKNQPLYIFDYSKSSNGVEASHLMEGEEERENSQISNTSKQQNLKQVEWCYINSADSLIILTDIAIKSFEIELNNYSKVVEIQKYDKEISSFCLLQKNEGEDHYVVCLGIQNLIICDLGLGKIERIQCECEGDERPRKDLIAYGIQGKEWMGLKMNGHMYILKNSDIEALFA